MTSRDIQASERTMSPTGLFLIFFNGWNLTLTISGWLHGTDCSVWVFLVNLLTFDLDECLVTAFSLLKFSVIYVVNLSITGCLQVVLCLQILFTVHVCKVTLSLLAMVNVTLSAVM